MQIGLRHFFFFFVPVCFRCILVCSAHMLRGSALHVHVHGDGHLPVHTEEAPVKRSASKFPVIHLITGFMPPLFQYPTSIIFCVHPPRITLIFEVHSRYYISEHVISLQIITTWLKALRTGKLLSLQQHGWKKPTNIGVLFSATHSPHLVPTPPTSVFNPALGRRSPVWSACLLPCQRKRGGTGRSGAKTTRWRYRQRYRPKVNKCHSWV